jgi:hypothetical protein
MHFKKVFKLKEINLTKKAFNTLKIGYNNLKLKETTQLFYTIIE